MLDSVRSDNRIVLTLDAGGSSFRFSATQGGRTIVASPPAPSHADNLERCIDTLIAGFSDVHRQCGTAPVAISFAFPGPADYPAGIIRDLPNLPAFRGGVALGPMLNEHFRLPVFINNDGNLFAYGEAMAGFLPHVNAELAQAGSPKRYHNLLGVTFGTGFGGGIVQHGVLLTGDNSSGGETWLLRNKRHPHHHAEHGVGIKAVRRVYAELAGIPAETAPEPKVINQIARGEAAGNRAAAVEAFRQLGEIAGDAIAQALTLVDGLVVIGGGMARASDLFMPALVAAVNDVFTGAETPLPRLSYTALNFEDPPQRERFLRREMLELVVPRSKTRVTCDRTPFTAIGLSRLGTSEAIALGAYAFALNAIDRGAAA